jgi:hypothetical protein
MGKPIDLKGQRFGKWTIIEKAESPPGYGHLQFWLCRCDCGTEQVRKGAQMRYAEKKGAQQACMRCAATKHGLSDTPEFNAWNQMHDRCRRQNHPAFMHYGGRGISVCERWSDFANFLADMGERPTPKHSLDRIDNNGNYSPDNCRWALPRTQTRNQSTTVMLAHDGRTQCIMDWANELGVSHAVIWQRINTLKWTVAEALNTPIGKSCNWRGTHHKDARQYEANGEKHTMQEWSHKLGIQVSTLRNRVRRGGSVVGK